MATKSNTDLIAMAEEWFMKLPPLPENARETLAKFAPILALIFGILGLITGIAGLGVLTAFLPLAVFGGAAYGAGYFAALFLIASSVLMLVAYPQLQAKKLSGWKLLFWGEVLNLVYGVVSMSIGSGIIGALIGFYLLFQIKSFFK